MRFFSAVLLILNIILCTQAFALVAKSPSDVYTQADVLKQKVIYLRQQAGIKAKYPKIALQKNKSPRHVLQKSLEVLAKINRYRIINNYGQMSIPNYPSRAITPSDVYYYVKRLNMEVTPFIDNDQLRGKKFLNSLTLKDYKNKTPSDVYQLLWSVSLAFDPLLGIRGFTPTDVYEQSETIVAIAKFLRQSQGEFSKIIKPEAKKGLHPNHALNTSYDLLRKIALIEKKLWMKQTTVPEKPYQVISPTHVYDSLQNIIAELQRLKTRLGVERFFEIKQVTEDKTPSDVVANLLYAKALLPDFKVSKKLKQYDTTLLQKTPNDVFALTQEILTKLNRIGNYKGINLNIEQPPYIYDLSPHHVYQKGIESIEKLIKFKTSEGFFKSDIPTQPFKNVTPSEVYELVDRLDSITSLIIYKNYNQQVKQYKYQFSKNQYSNKTPSDVYNNLWKISRKLDRLLGTEYTPNETYMLATEINIKVNAIINHFKLTANVAIPDRSTKSPRDVFMASIALYDVLKKARVRANIKSKIIIIPVEDKITPNSVYNALRIITASINSFNIHYGIVIPDKICSNTVTGKTPTDVYKLITQASNKLNGLFTDENY